ncbi:Hypothetical_protein [Hexamita inflata]|uniref:Hypothetical_protein n=1 Tax=Hexamita inflata TaxID=28002 RepID=A0AA86UHW5_9EUKA|nr:Hypothetical protein HINF_LOCUS28413 [Hexamita inflata]
MGSRTPVFPLSNGLNPSFMPTQQRPSRALTESLADIYIYFNLRTVQKTIQGRRLTRLQKDQRAQQPTIVLQTSLKESSERDIKLEQSAKTTTTGWKTGLNRTSALWSTEFRFIWILESLGILISITLSKSSIIGTKRIKMVTRSKLFRSQSVRISIFIKSRENSWKNSKLISRRFMKRQAT